MSTPDRPQSDRDEKISRREALEVLLLGIGAAGIVADGILGLTSRTVVQSAKHLIPATSSSFPRMRITNVASLSPNHPVAFQYPQKTQQNWLIDLGQEVQYGVGSMKSIVAFSSVCQHMGCPVQYEPSQQLFRCSCHQSTYDPSMAAMVVLGQAPTPLPRIALEIDDVGDIYATDVYGVIYGYNSNV
ncbi:arsenate reductase (azurin) small subunit [Alicyclobacillus curvatus]|nr:arsenate reductase (azurin) small subunit [Alicyclobacillus curvatus]